jgi:hypothetical protein
MGVASSHAIGNGLLPSPMKDFYPPRVNGRTSYSNNSPANQPRILNPGGQSLSLPTSPLLNQDNFSPRSEVPSNRTVQHSSFQDPNFQSSGSSSPRKSIPSQAPPPVPKTGKPLIFAAMSPQVDELDRDTTSFSKPPRQQVQSSVKKQASQSTTPVQQPQPQHQPSAKASTNGSDSSKPSLLPQLFPATPAKIPNHSVEQLPPTPPSHTRGSSRSSRVSKPDVQRSQTQPQHIPPTSSRKDSKSDQQIPLSPPVPRSPSRSSKDSTEQRPRPRKLSKPRRVGSPHGDIILPSTPDSQHHGPNSVRTFTKSRPSTPVATTPHKSLFGSPKPTPLEPAFQLDEDTTSTAGTLLDDDPFARVEGVTLMKPKHRDRKNSKGSSQSSLISRESGKAASEQGSVSPMIESVAPPTPISPEEHRKRKTKKKKKKQSDKDGQIEPTHAPVADDSDSAVTAPEEQEQEPEPEPEPIPLYTMIDLISDPQLLSSLLTFFSFYDWCVLSSLSNEIRMLLIQTPVLRETVLERFLKTVGYSRWVWDGPDPLLLSLQVR